MIKKIFIVLLSVISINIFSQDVNVDTFATGFNRPVNIQNAGDDRLFIVEQDGIIKVVDATGNTNATPFLNIDAIVGSNGNEQGLLGLAFHPDYATNGFFFVNYTNNSGDTVIARYSVSANADVADNSSAQILLTIDQPFSNHNGGNIVFGFDGYLYIGMGDGGSGGDPNNNAQNGNSLLGKILRIEVGADNSYNIPADNPFVGDATVRDEIWAIGVRNPWKFSFDSENGDLWIGDVGQNAIEEIDHVTGAGAGLNYGWRCYEGNSPFNTSGCGNVSNYTMPVAQYNQGGSPYKCAITGGYVYRGSLYPDFTGLYFFADYCSDQIGTVDPNNGYQMIFNNGFTGSFSSFGEDVNHELYVAGLANGKIYKIKDDTLGLEGNVLATNISISPNPAINKVTIKSKSAAYSINNLKAFNVIGTKVLDFNIDNMNEYQLNLQGLKQGIYFLKITLNNNESVVKKLIIK